jgi:hypothetical protein
MRDLASLQRAFAQALDASDEREASLSMLADRHRSRFRVYREQQQANVRRALRNAFPVVASTLGESAFDALARDYVRTHPSQDGDLNRLGERLPRFVRSRFAADGGWLAELAALDWSAHRAHYAADRATLDIARLASVPAERYGDLRLVLDDAVALHAFEWQVASAWQSCRSGADDAWPPARGSERAVVARPRFRVLVSVVDAAEYACLASCAAGGTLEVAVDAALAVDPAFAFDAVLKRWVVERVVVDFTVDAPTPPA